VIILSTTEAADLLRRSPAAVRNLVMRRAIPYRKPGGRLVFLKEELERWIRESPGVKIDDLRDE
jgi:excisionase family DNA binding protein